MGTMDILTLVEANPDFPRHGSATIVELRDGGLLLAWMEHVGGEAIGHDHAPCNIASMISSDGGYTWTDHRILVENKPGDINIHYPSFLRLKSGDILFYYQRQHELAPGAPQKATGFLCRSGDDGKTFSPQRKHDTIQDTNIAGNLLVQLSSGRIILPIQKVIGDWCGATDHQVNSCCYSDDEGHSWKESACWVDLPLRGAMEPHIVELNDGRLLMYMRTPLGAVFQSDSADGGETWSKPQTTGLRAPESMPCLIKIPKTDHLLVIWNNSLYDPEFDHCGKRTPLTAAISKDDGRTWENIKNIETDPEWEFTNPVATVTRGGNLLIAYEASKYESLAGPGYGNVGQTGRVGRTRMHLKLAIIDIDWLYE